MWLRDLGLLAWFLVGVAVLLVGLVVAARPDLDDHRAGRVGAILATVAGPLVTNLQRRRVPRAAGAALVLLGMLIVAAVIALMVFAGLFEQSDQIKAAANEAVDRIQGWMNDAGAGGTSSTAERRRARRSRPGSPCSRASPRESRAGVARLLPDVHRLLDLLPVQGRPRGAAVRRPATRCPAGRGGDHHGERDPVAPALLPRRDDVAAFNAIVVGLAAIVLDVPLAGTIAVVVFVTAYVPFIGAFVSGAFAVILALASQGTTTALIMLVVVILANGLLQNIVQPIAFGATLDLNPLVVLIVTIGAGSLFGMIGMVLAAPLTSAALHISRELALAKARLAAAVEPPPAAPPEPAPAG